MTATVRSDISQVPVDTTRTRVYGSTIAARLAGISYRQIDHWERSGVLIPSVQEAHGPGTSRQYSAEDVKLAAILGELSRLGAKLLDLSGATTCVREALQEGVRWLVVSPSGSVQACADGVIGMAMEANQIRGAWILDLRSIEEEIPV